MNIILDICDWRFQIDREKTQEQTKNYSLDHCECGYCRNYYQAIALVYPELLTFLHKFGVDYNGPSEVMPFEPTLMLACYRVQGKILKFGREVLVAGGIPVIPEAADEHSFFLWVGEMSLPWLQEEPEEDVISPANLPEFMERMEQIWILRHGNSIISS